MNKQLWQLSSSRVVVVGWCQLYEVVQVRLQEALLLRLQAVLPQHPQCWVWRELGESHPTKQFLWREEGVVRFWWVCWLSYCLLSDVVTSFREDIVWTSARKPNKEWRTSCHKSSTTGAKTNICPLNSLELLDFCNIGRVLTYITRCRGVNITITIKKRNEMRKA